MKRTQLQLADPVYEAVRRRAYERRTSVAGIVREALAAYLSPAPGPRAAAKRKPLKPWPFVGIGRIAGTKRGPASERHDDLLADDFGH